MDLFLTRYTRYCVMQEKIDAYRTTLARFLAGLEVRVACHTAFAGVNWRSEYREARVNHYDWSSKSYDM